MKGKEKIILYGTIMLLLVPAMLSNIWPEISASIFENRSIPGFPAMPASLTQLYMWPSQFDAFLENHFFMRNVLIYNYSNFFYRYLGVSINENVIVGKNGWLYISKSDNAIDKYRGIYTFTSDAQKEDWINRLNRLAQWTEKKGIDFIFVIIPSKPTVYPEYLPDVYHAVGPTLTDAITEALKKDADFNWVDLRPTLIKAAQTEKVFFEHDTHWNERGSYLGYIEVMKKIQEVCPVHIMTSSDISFQVKSKTGGDLAQQLGLNNIFHENIPVAILKNSIVTSRTGDFLSDCVRVSTSKKEFPSALVLCDSFVIAYMSPFLSESFSFSLYKNHLGLRFDRSIIEEVNPDIVLVMITERVLPIEITVKKNEVQLPKSWFFLE